MDDDAQAAPAYPTWEQVDEVIAEFGGDARQAIAALMHDLAVIAADYDASVSRGFRRAPPAASAFRKRA